MNTTSNPFDDATIIHSYQPEIIPNTRELPEGMPDNLEQHLRQFTGTNDGAAWSFPSPSVSFRVLKTKGREAI